jgi:hypothetical protein
MFINPRRSIFDFRSIRVFHFPARGAPPIQLIVSNKACYKCRSTFSARDKRNLRAFYFLCRTYGARLFFYPFPGLTPWANVLTRLRRCPFTVPAFALAD